MRKISWFITRGSLLKTDGRRRTIDDIEEVARNIRNQQATIDEVEEAAKKFGVCMFCGGPASLRIAREHRFADRTEIVLQYACDECWETARLSDFQLRCLDRYMFKREKPRRSKNVDISLEALIAKVRAQEWGAEA